LKNWQLAVVVIFLFGAIGVLFYSLPRGSHTTDTLEIYQDKSVCAAAGIELVNYKSGYNDSADASGKLTVKYSGKQSTCTVVANATGNVTCKIFIKSQANKCMRIFVNSSGGCLIQAETVDY
jgi:hypothetical protein